MAKLHQRLIVAFIVLAGTACGDDPLAPEAAESIAITTLIKSVPIHHWVQLEARLLNKSGAVIPYRDVIWSTTDSAIATISPIGLLEAHNFGKVTVFAKLDSKSASLEVTVDSGVVKSILIFAGGVSLRVGGSMKLTTSMLDSTERVIPDRPISWAVAPANRATISADGIVTALATGDITIFATAGNVTGKIFYFILPP